jgi:hypothetical protein
MNNAGVFVLFIALAVGAQDTGKVPSNFLGVDPIDLLLGSFVVNFEHVFSTHHGVVVEGQYSIPIFTESWYGFAGYRYHFEHGAKGSFVGPFCRKGRLKSKLEDEYKEEFPYRLEYLTFGADWGTRGKAWKKVPYTLRIGFGYPVHTLSWDRRPPEKVNKLDIEVYKKILKLPAYMDSELTVFYSF